MLLVIFKKMKIKENFTIYIVYEISAKNLAYIDYASNIFKFSHSDVIFTFHIYIF